MGDLSGWPAGPERPCRRPDLAGHRRWPGTVAPAHRSTDSCNQRRAGVLQQLLSPDPALACSGPDDSPQAGGGPTALALRGQPDP